MLNTKTFAGLTAIGLAGLFATSAMAAEPSHGAPKAAGHGAPVKQVAAAPAAPAAHGTKKKAGGPPHWTYAGKDGPAKWGDLSPAFRACNMGVQQSPINLHNAIGAEIGSVTVNYRSTAFDVVNNGHTIQVNVEPGSTIMLDGVDYKLLQFHFHHPSEHLKDGKAFEMEAHFVHISEKGVLAVLGVGLGLAGAVVLGRVVESRLFGVEPVNVVVYLSAAVALGLVALVASYRPARAATLVDPVAALKYE